MTLNDRLSEEQIEELVTELLETLSFVIQAAGHALSEAEREEFMQRTQGMMEMFDETDEDRPAELVDQGRDVLEQLHEADEDSLSDLIDRGYDVLEQLREDG